MRRITRTIGVLAVLMLVLGSCITMPVLADGETSISINAPDEVAPGSSFTVTIDITGVEDLNAAQYDISFDPSVLRLDSVSDGQISSTAISAMSNKIDAGHWRIVQSMGLSKISGSGNLVTLHFRAVGTVGASSGINITDGLLGDFDMNAIQATWGTKSVSVISDESGDGDESSTSGSTTGSAPDSTPSSSPSSSPAPSTEPEPEDSSGTIAETKSPALLPPPSPVSEKAAVAAPESGASVAEPDTAPAKLLPPAPEPEPLSQPWLWITAGGVVVIIVIFIIVRLSRRPF